MFVFLFSAFCFAGGAAIEHYFLSYFLSYFLLILPLRTFTGRGSQLSLITCVTVLCFRQTGLPAFFNKVTLLIMAIVVAGVNWLFHAGDIVTFFTAIMTIVRRHFLCISHSHYLYSLYYCYLLLLLLSLLAPLPHFFSALAPSGFWVPSASSQKPNQMYLHPNNIDIKSGNSPP